jgi:hypothetical protein
MKSQLPEIVDEFGWEGSVGAYRHAQVIVLEIAEEFELEWPNRAFKKYLKFNHRTGLKVNDLDFNFVTVKTSQIWDLFRNYLLSENVNGKWNDETIIPLSRILEAEYDKNPIPYKTNIVDRNRLVVLTLMSLDKCVQEDKQIVANAVIEFIQILWCHHSNSVR